MYLKHQKSESPLCRMRGIFGVLGSSGCPGWIPCIIKNNGLIIKVQHWEMNEVRSDFFVLSTSVSCRMGTSGLLGFKPRGLYVFSYMLTKASPSRSNGCPLFDTATASRQRFSPLTVGPSSISECRRAVRPPPSVLALHPSPRSVPLSPSSPLPAATWVIGPLASHRHYYRIIMIHSLNGCG